MVPFLLTCCPLLLLIFPWARLLRSPHRASRIVYIATAMVTANALFAACLFAWSLRPAPPLPPWEDPIVLDAALLILLAPIGVVLTVIASSRGMKKSEVGSLLTASVVLFLVGCASAVSV